MDNYSSQHSGPTPTEPTHVQPQRKKETMTFGKTFLASMLGFIAAITAMTLVAGIFLALIVMSLSSSEEETMVLDNSVLQLKLSGSIPEYVGAESITSLFGGGTTTTMREYVEGVRAAAEIDDIKGIWLQMNGFGGSASQVEALTRALNDFRSTGKFVYAVSDVDGFSEGDYLLAACADSVFLAHSGSLELNGSYAVLEFYKPLLDKLNIKPIMVRAGSYKSAVEPFTRSEPSPEYLEALGGVVDAQYGKMKDLVAAGRGMTRVDIDSIVATYPLIDANTALSLRLVDRLVYDDEVDGLFRRRLGITDSTEDVETINISDLIEDDRRWEEHGGDQIAIVYAVGSINVGESRYNPSPIFGGEEIGSTTFVEAMREAREDDDIKAIVLRINSPGGGVQPSIAMWREVKLAAAVKPVIVSMAGVAASGGYYIAAPGTEIYAEESTVTGSIGVFALAFNLDGFYRETIGINTTTYRTGPHADILSLMRDLTPEEMAFAEAEVGTIYNEFLSVVADGRNLSKSAVDSIAQGRIWTGKQASERGLVDKIGGLEDAMARAAELGGLQEDDFSVVEYPQPQHALEALFSQLGVAAEHDQTLSVESLLNIEDLVKSSLQSYSGVQARLAGIRF